MTRSIICRYEKVFHFGSQRRLSALLRRGSDECDPLHVSWALGPSGLEFYCGFCVDVETPLETRTITRQDDVVMVCRYCERDFYVPGKMITRCRKQIDAKVEKTRQRDVLGEAQEKIRRLEAEIQRLKGGTK